MQTKLQNINQIKILLPQEREEKLYRFTNTIVQTENKIIKLTKIVRKISIRFSGIENNMWRYQMVCLGQDIEAKHIGSTTILQLRDTIFNEVKMYVNQNGAILQILNLKEIKKLWVNEKNELRNKHEGAVLEDFFINTDLILENNESILKYISTKEMYGLYFNSCWGYHDIQKPRFPELKIIIEKRIQKDRFNPDFDKLYSNDAKLIITKQTETQKQESEFTYKNHQLQEAFLEIQEENKNSKYSVVCLT